MMGFTYPNCIILMTPTENRESVSVGVFLLDTTSIHDISRMDVKTKNSFECGELTDNIFY